MREDCRLSRVLDHHLLLVRAHQKQLYSLLFNSAAAALLKLAADPRYLGAKPALLGVLHTWIRAMFYHPHVHFLVSAGGMAADGVEWVEPKNAAFLAPVRALSVIFRAKFCDGLREAGLLAGVDAGVWAKGWVVHSQHAGSGQKVLDYLGRYLFRVAIANSRLESLEGDHVRFHYRDNDSGQICRLTLHAHEFIARFLQHVLPRGLAKVRYYGLWSAACRPQMEAARRCLTERTPLPSPEPAAAEETPAAGATPNTPSAARICPLCRTGKLQMIAVLRRVKKPPGLPLPGGGGLHSLPCRIQAL